MNRRRWAVWVLLALWLAPLAAPSGSASRGRSNGHDCCHGVCLCPHADRAVHTSCSLLARSACGYRPAPTATLVSIRGEIALAPNAPFAPKAPTEDPRFSTLPSRAPQTSDRSERPPTPPPKTLLRST